MADLHSETDDLEEVFGYLDLYEDNGGGDCIVETIPIKEREFSIGRETNCHFRMNNIRVSRHQCSVTIEDIKGKPQATLINFTDRPTTYVGDNVLQKNQKVILQAVQQFKIVNQCMQWRQAKQEDTVEPVTQHQNNKLDRNQKSNEEEEMDNTEKNEISDNSVSLQEECRQKIRNENEEEIKSPITIDGKESNDEIVISSKRVRGQKKTNQDVTVEDDWPTVVEASVDDDISTLPTPKRGSGQNKTDVIVEEESATAVEAPVDDDISKLPMPKRGRAHNKTNQDVIVEEESPTAVEAQVDDDITTIPKQTKDVAGEEERSEVEMSPKRGHGQDKSVQNEPVEDQIPLAPENEEPKILTAIHLRRSRGNLKPNEDDEIVNTGKNETSKNSTPLRRGRRSKISNETEEDRKTPNTIEDIESNDDTVISLKRGHGQNQTIQDLIVEEESPTAVEAPVDDDISKLPMPKRGRAHNKTNQDVIVEEESPTAGEAKVDDDISTIPTPKQEQGQNNQPKDVTGEEEITTEVGVSPKQGHGQNKIAQNELVKDQIPNVPENEGSEILTTIHSRRSRKHGHQKAPEEIVNIGKNETSKNSTPLRRGRRSKIRNETEEVTKSPNTLDRVESTDEIVISSKRGGGRKETNQDESPTAVETQVDDDISTLPTPKRGRGQSKANQDVTVKDESPIAVEAQVDDNITTLPKPKRGRGQNKTNQDVTVEDSPTTVDARVDEDISTLPTPSRGRRQNKANQDVTIEDESSTAVESQVDDDITTIPTPKRGQGQNKQTKEAAVEEEIMAEVGVSPKRGHGQGKAVEIEPVKDKILSASDNVESEILTPIHSHTSRRRGHQKAIEDEEMVNTGKNKTSKNSTPLRRGRRPKNRSKTEEDQKAPNTIEGKESNDETVISLKRGRGQKKKNQDVPVEEESLTAVEAQVDDDITTLPKQTTDVTSEEEKMLSFSSEVSVSPERGHGQNKAVQKETGKDRIPPAPENEESEILTSIHSRRGRGHQKPNEDEEIVNTEKNETSKNAIPLRRGRRQKTRNENAEDQKAPNTIEAKESNDGTVISSKRGRGRKTRNENAEDQKAPNTIEAKEPKDGTVISLKRGRGQKKKNQDVPVEEESPTAVEAQADDITTLPKRGRRQNKQTKEVTAEDGMATTSEMDVPPKRARGRNKVVQNVPVKDQADPENEQSEIVTAISSKRGRGHQKPNEYEEMVNTEKTETSDNSIPLRRGRGQKIRNENTVDQEASTTIKSINSEESNDKTVISSKRGRGQKKPAVKLNLRRKVEEQEDITVSSKPRRMQKSARVENEKLDVDISESDIADCKDQSNLPMSSGSTQERAKRKRKAEKLESQDLMSGSSKRGRPKQKNVTEKNVYDSDDEEVKENRDKDVKTLKQQGRLSKELTGDLENINAKELRVSLTRLDQTEVEGSNVKKVDSSKTTKQMNALMKKINKKQLRVSLTEIVPKQVEAEEKASLSRGRRPNPKNVVSVEAESVGTGNVKAATSLKRGRVVHKIGSPVGSDAEAMQPDMGDIAEMKVAKLTKGKAPAKRTRLHANRNSATDNVDISENDEETTRKMPNIKTSSTEQHAIEVDDGKTAGENVGRKGRKTKNIKDTETELKKVGVQKKKIVTAQEVSTRTTRRTRANP